MMMDLMFNSCLVTDPLYVAVVCQRHTHISFSSDSFDAGDVQSGHHRRQPADAVKSVNQSIPVL